GLRRGHPRPALCPPGRRGPDGPRRAQRRGPPVRPQLRRAQPVHHRRQRAADPGGGQPGPDHHGRGRPRRRPAGRRGPEWDAVMTSDPLIESVEAAAYKIPADAPEGDGTLAWDATTMVLARVRAGDTEGIGWTYGSAAAATDLARMRQAREI